VEVLIPVARGTDVVVRVSGVVAGFVRGVEAERAGPDGEVVGSFRAGCWRDWGDGLEDCEAHDVGEDRAGGDFEVGRMLMGRFVVEGEGVEGEGRVEGLAGGAAHGCIFPLLEGEVEVHFYVCIWVWVWAEVVAASQL